MKRLVATILLALAQVTIAAAQDFPNRPLTMVVPFAAGGPTDTVGRLLAAAMSENLGQQVVVENVDGAGGTLGAARVATAPPDGYTILLWHIGMATTATLYKNLPFDAATSFAPIGLVSEVPMTVIGNGRFPAGTPQQLVELVRARGLDISMAHAGIGSASHLCSTLFQSVLGVKVTTVPYGGTSPAMQDLQGDYVDLMCDQTTTTAIPIDTLAVKGYIITARERLRQIRNVQTFLEAGLEGFEITVWNGLWAPAGTPEAVVGRLNEALLAALQSEMLKRRMAVLATTPIAPERATPAELEALVASEIERWRPIILAGGEFVE
jgi:tripartite-type tricarboxylate transporter receptor subunit TctC